MANPVRILTAAGWQDLTATQGPSGAVLVFEQPDDPGSVPLGSMWIETDVQISSPTPLPNASGQDGKWLQAAGGVAVWTPIPTLRLDPDTVWHIVGAAGEPGFLNGWTNYGGQFPVARFRRDALGYVHLSGLIRSGSPTTPAFKIPAGYRPSSYLHIASSGNDAMSTTRADVNGDIYGGAQTAWHSLDGVVYLAEQ
jgi:hypothetical protein